MMNAMTTEAINGEAMESPAHCVAAVRGRQASRAARMRNSRRNLEIAGGDRRCGPDGRRGGEGGGGHWGNLQHITVAITQ